ncbi:class I SAM-dependent DNA methyltransferase [Streptomyces sp. NPDC005263]|uniref:class I SAM-dependent DNA methyltransferase n=1 Tax=Streptomyces sp. NPDC005263 TaxID=3364711 RepID=UPI0036803EEC
MTEPLEETIRSYDSHAQAYARRFAAAEMTREQELFAVRLPRRSRPVLDAGCGAGRDFRGFRLLGVEPIGVDLSAGLLTEARRCADASLIQADMLRLPFRAVSFRGVWCCASLMHLTPPQAAMALREFRRTLTDDGVLFVLVREGNIPGRRATSWRDRTGRWFHPYDREAMEQLLQSAGFTVVHDAVLSRPHVGRWIGLLAVVSPDTGSSRRRAAGAAES